MAEKRLITVFGATGVQGGSVARAALEAGHRVRAVMRDPTSAAALALAQQGAELAKANFTDDSTLATVVSGSYAVFGFTLTIYGQDGERQEVKQGVALARAAKHAGVHIFIWSGVPSTDEISQGAVDVPIFMAKAKVWQEVKSMGFAACVSLELPSFYSNLGTRAMPVIKGQDGSAIIQMPVLGPQDQLTSFDPHDTGLPVPEILADPQQYDKARILYRGSDEPLSAWADTFTRVTGVKADIATTPYEELAQRSKGYADMFLCIQRYGYYGGPEHVKGMLDASSVSGKALTTFEQYVQQNTSSLVQGLS